MMWRVGMTSAALCLAVMGGGGCGDDGESSGGAGGSGVGGSGLGGTGLSGTGAGGEGGSFATYEILVRVSGEEGSTHLHATTREPSPAGPVSLNDPTDTVESFSISPSRQYVAYVTHPINAEEERTLRLWRTDGMVVPVSVPSAKAPGSSSDIVWAPAGSERFTYQTDTGVAIVTIDGLEATHHTAPDLDDYPRNVTWAAGGDYLAAAGGNRYAVFDFDAPAGTIASIYADVDSANFNWYPRLSWHPSEPRLAAMEYVEEDVVAPYHLHVSTVTGSSLGPQTLIGNNSGSLNRFRWSHSGHAMFYGEPTCLVADGDGIDDAVCFDDELASDFYDVGTIAFSADDRWLSFQGSPEGGLYLVASADPATASIVHGVPGNIYNGTAWTASGDYLLYRDDGGWQVAHTPASSVQETTTIGDVSAPVLSPQDDVIAMIEHADADPKIVTVVLRDLTGGEADLTVDPATLGGQVARVTWSPQGDALAIEVSGAEGDEVLVVASDGSSTQEVFSGSFPESINRVYWLR